MASDGVFLIHDAILGFVVIMIKEPCFVIHCYCHPLLLFETMSFHSKKDKWMPQFNKGRP